MRKRIAAVAFAIAAIFGVGVPSARLLHERYYCNAAWNSEVKGRQGAVEYNRIAEEEGRVDRISIPTASKGEVIDRCLDSQKRHRAGFLDLLHDGGSD